ncbi:MAG: Gfo/Idh/MocA family oxidoreductase [Treponema sp.]|nr:Gfo/Idh/MocA family oxidoreductase [Treponema sp.]
MEKIKAAIIGLGRIASLLEEDSRREKPCTHAGAISANPDCILAGGCDTSEEQRMLFAERWGVPVYSSAEEMIRAGSPQLLVIATYPDSHLFYCRLAADLGIPAVICEKPLADTLSAARKIAALTTCCRNAPKKRSTVIITNHERRYSADYLKARDILSCEKLGPLLSVRAVLYMGNNKRLLDVLWHDGTHLADAVMFLSGRKWKHRRQWGADLFARAGTAWLEGELKKGAGNKDWGVGNREWGISREVSKQSGLPTCRDHKQRPPLPIIIELGAGRDYIAFELEFSCSRGRLRIGNGIFEVWESVESPYAENFRSLKLTGDVFTGPTGYFANMLADAVSCIREPGRRPVSSAEDGLAVIEYLNSVSPWR